MREKELHSGACVRAFAMKLGDSYADNKGDGTVINPEDKDDKKGVGTVQGTIRVEGGKVPDKPPPCYPPENSGDKGGNHRGSGIDRAVGDETVDQKKHHESRYVGHGKRVDTLKEAVEANVQDRDIAHEILQN